MTADGKKNVAVIGAGIVGGETSGAVETGTFPRVFAGGNAKRDEGPRFLTDPGGANRAVGSKNVVERGSRLVG